MSKLIFDMDTQEGIINNDSNTELVNIERILIEAMRTDTLISGTVYFDEHVNYEKLSDTIVVDDEFIYTIPATRHGIDMNIADNCYQVYFEKLGSDIWDEEIGQPDNLMTFIRTNDVSTVYIIGNAYDGNIIDMYVGSNKSKYNIVIVEDSISNFTPTIRDQLVFLNGDGDNLRFITTDQLIKELYE